MRAMILAAGRGERMRPLTDHTPKPLLRVAGETLIERHLRALAAGGVRDVVINAAWLGSLLRERLGDGRALGLVIRWSEEPPGALETGGGIRRALPLLGDGPFLVINGDVWIDQDVAQLGRTLVPAGEDLAGLLLVPTPAWKPRHDFALAGDRVSNDAPCFTFAGIGVYRAALFDDAPDAEAFPLGPLLHAAAARGRVRGVLFDGRWSDVGTPARLAALDETVRRERGEME